MNKIFKLSATFCRKNLYQQSYRHYRLFQTKLRGSDILNDRYNYPINSMGYKKKYQTQELKSLTSDNLTMDYNDTCFEILNKMNDNNVKYICITDENNHKKIVCYDNVSNICGLNEWFVEEDLKVVCEMTLEK